MESLDKKVKQEKNKSRYMERLNSYHGSAVLLTSYYNQFVLLVQDNINKKWSLPKGKFEPHLDFSFTSTVIRETHEETGLIYNYDYFFTGYIHKELDYMIYTAHSIFPVLRKSCNIEENVCNIRWFNSNEVKEIVNKKLCNLLTSIVLKRTVLYKNT